MRSARVDPASPRKARPAEPAWRTRHEDLEDRFRAPLRPRRELMEAIWNIALHRTDARRRREGRPREPINRVAVWAQLGQAALVAAYQRHQKYLGEPNGLSTRTLTRHVACLESLDLVRVIRPVRPDGAGGWKREHNVYSVTYRGKLWIKKHARAVRIPAVV